MRMLSEFGIRLWHQQQNQREREGLHPERERESGEAGGCQWNNYVLSKSKDGGMATDVCASGERLF